MISDPTKSPAEIGERMEAIEMATEPTHICPQCNEPVIESACAEHRARHDVLEECDALRADLQRERDGAIALRADLRQAQELYADIHQKWGMADAGRANAERERDTAQRELGRMRELLAITEVEDDEGESEANICGRCGDEYHLPNGYEPTPECDRCAHEVLAEARTALAGGARGEGSESGSGDSVEGKPESVSGPQSGDATGSLRTPDETAGMYATPGPLPDSPTPPVATSGGGERRCAHCGSANVACVGSYEGHEPVSYACNDCCGHGNEDGRCRPVEPPPTPTPSEAAHEKRVEGILRHAARAGETLEKAGQYVSDGERSEFWVSAPSEAGERCGNCGHHCADHNLDGCQQRGCACGVRSEAEGASGGPIKPVSVNRNSGYEDNEWRLDDGAGNGLPIWIGGRELAEHVAAALNTAPPPASGAAGQGDSEIERLALKVCGTWEQHGVHIRVESVEAELCRAVQARREALRSAKSKS